MEYDDGKPVRVDTVVISAQHNPDVTHEQIEEDMINKVIKAIIPARFLDENTKYLINPTGRFVIGGKDPTKVDRSAAYAARYVAKNIVAAGIADKCEIELAYAIGVAEPVSIFVDTFGTGKIDDEKIVDLIRRNFELLQALSIC